MTGTDMAGCKGYFLEYSLVPYCRHNTWRPQALRWYMPEAGTTSHMFVARMGPDLRIADRVTVIRCPQLKDKVATSYSLV